MFQLQYIPRPCDTSLQKNANDCRAFTAFSRDPEASANPAMELELQIRLQSWSAPLCQGENARASETWTMLKLNDLEPPPGLGSQAGVHLRTLTCPTAWFMMATNCHEAEGLERNCMAAVCANKAFLRSREQCSSKFMPLMPLMPYDHVRIMWGIVRR